MRIILFGASGMVGASALREALKAPEVESVLCIGRRSCGIEHHKLRELRLPDLFDFAAVEDQLTGIVDQDMNVSLSGDLLHKLFYRRLVVEINNMVYMALPDGDIQLRSRQA